MEKTRIISSHNFIKGFFNLSRYRPRNLRKYLTFKLLDGLNLTPGGRKKYLISLKHQIGRKAFFFRADTEYGRHFQNRFPRNTPQHRSQGRGIQGFILDDKNGFSTSLGNKTLRVQHDAHIGALFRRLFAGKNPVEVVRCGLGLDGNGLRMKFANLAECEGQFRPFGEFFPFHVRFRVNDCNTGIHGFLVGHNTYGNFSVIAHEFNKSALNLISTDRLKNSLLEALSAHGEGHLQEVRRTFQALQVFIKAENSRAFHGLMQTHDLEDSRAPAETVGHEMNHGRLPRNQLSINIYFSVSKHFRLLQKLQLFWFCHVVFYTNARHGSNGFFEGVDFIPFC